MDSIHWFLLHTCQLQLFFAYKSSKFCYRCTVLFGIILGIVTAIRKLLLPLSSNITLPSKIKFLTYNNMIYDNEIFNYCRTLVFISEK